MFHPTNKNRYWGTGNPKLLGLKDSTTRSFWGDLDRSIVYNFLRREQHIITIMTCHERSTTSYHTKVVFYTRTRPATKIPAGHVLLMRIIHLMKNKQIANIFGCQQILMNPPSHVHKVSHFFLLALKVRSFREITLHPISRPQTTNKPPDWYNKLNIENGPHLAWNFHCCCSLALQAGWSLDGMADKPWRLSGLWRSVFLFKWRSCWGDVPKPKNPKFIVTIHIQIHAGAMIYMKRSIKSGYINKKKLIQKHSTPASKVSMWLAFPVYQIQGVENWWNGWFCWRLFAQAWVTKNGGNIGASWATNKHYNSFARNRHMQIVFP